MKKRVLIINNEWSPENPGLIAAGTLPGITEDIRLASMLEEQVRAISGYETRVVFHRDIIPELIEEYAPDYIIAGGRWKHWEPGALEEEYEAECALIRTTQIPYLGICAGHQMLSVAYGNPIGKMVESEQDVLELGYTPVMTEEDVLFQGLPCPLHAMMIHRDEIKVLPAGFEGIASTEMCKYAAIRHTARPMWGVQFHPEILTAAQRDGAQLLQNFLSL